MMENSTIFKYENKHDNFFTPKKIMLFPNVLKEINKNIKILHPKDVKNYILFTPLYK